MDNIFLYVRRTKKYLDGEIDMTLPIKLQPHFDRSMMLWKMFFKMSYIEFRHRLAAIASLSYNLSRFDGFFEYSNWEEIRKYKDIWIIPIDDDDWLHPNILETLRSLDVSDKSIVRWNVTSITYNRETKSSNAGNACGFLRTRSCSYAVRWPCDEIIVDSHGDAHKYIDANYGKFLSVKECLSVKLGHWASVSFFTENSLDDILLFAQKRLFIKKNNLLKDYDHLVDLYNELLLDVYDSLKL